jgi:hypothetical protein
MKKVGITLIILGFLIPLILLLFFGDNWVPEKQVGIIYSIINSDLSLFKYKKDKIIRLEDSEGITWDDFTLIEEEGYITKKTYEKYSISFRYVAGLGLISIILGSLIIIREYYL